jgi:predicted O-methyltransferase YrrM
MLLRGSKTIRDVVGVLETLNFLSLRLLLRNPQGYRRFPGMVFRDWVKLNKGARWGCEDIFEVLEHLGGSPGRITLEHLPGEGIDTAIDELAYLALISRSLAPQLVFEFGTFRGRTALNFALNSPPSTKVLTLDLPEGWGRSQAMASAEASDAEIIRRSRTGADYAGKDVAHKIHQLVGDSLTFDFSPYFNKVDLVFVDGGHQDEVVSSDTRNALRMVRPGGVVVWHDFANYGNYSGITRAILGELPANQVFQIENSQLALYQKPGNGHMRAKPTPGLYQNRLSSQTVTSSMEKANRSE